MKQKILLFSLLLFTMSLSTSAQITDKTLKKEYKGTLKELKKGGWKVFASTQSLDEAWEKYFLKRQNDGGTPIVGRGEASNNNVANSKARVDAVKEYTTMLETQIEAEHDVSFINKDGETLQRFRSIVRANTEQCIRDMSPVLSLTRKVESGRYEMQLFYLVDMNKEIEKVIEEWQADK